MTASRGFDDAASASTNRMNDWLISPKGEINQCFLLIRLPLEQILDRNREHSWSMSIA